MRHIFVCFLEEIEETKMTFRNYLTFSSSQYGKHTTLYGTFVIRKWQYFLTKVMTIYLHREVSSGSRKASKQPYIIHKFPPIKYEEITFH